MSIAKIKVLKDGPYEITGKIILDHLKYVPNPKGFSVEYEQIEEYPDQDSYHLCRCGHSGKKPYCDGTHAKVGFNGTETAKNKTYDEMAKPIKGILSDLLDAEELCAGARFCDTKSGIWNLTTKAENLDAKDIIKHQGTHCPAGRLVVVTKEGERVEPKFNEMQISILEDPAAETIGPIWVKGGIPIESADGMVYHIRNRVTLCRCGKSKNKPFCDRSHFED